MRKLNWKKIVAGTLSAIMLLSVTACGSSRACLKNILSCSF